ncbi:hypothetical protein [Methylobacterium haplocladii]|uniref:Uncharacterized protein n=1 Tax=Methylobacterium haplocladii TaxID=1176176 RepID=A0A512IVM8_9HYPH|nr:hypothetical protein [Methylobacterium haplocladii]GEP01745.1 hypothetical protein MHA02_41320 [Methylobacterium haplocladii]GJD83563.1 hypothetical protein HPGCJGGD_1432 [Methylobacterium haplocladii]GLS59720.1 hypothetical protein GCM10007887_23910 [Methylobacterium haplocladii]
MTRYLSPTKVLALALVPVVAGIYLYVFKDLSAVVGGDVPSYVNLDPSRPVAYGAFLNAALKLGFGLDAIPLIQAAFLLGCLWATACAWTACTGQFLLALAWQGLTVANVLLVQSSVYILPDTVSAALIMLALASWIGIAARYSRTRLCVLLLVCGIAGLVRPTNLILLVVTGGLLLCLPGLIGRERLIGLGAATTVSLLTLVASPAFYFYRYGSAATSSPAARGLLQKTLFTGWPPDETAARCGGEVIGTATRDVVKYLEAAPPLERSVLEDKYSNYLRFSVIIPELQVKFDLKSEGEINSLIACYVFARFKQDPIHFGGRFARDYLRLGLYLVFIDAQQRAQYETFVAANPPPQPAASVRLGDQISEGLSRAGMILPLGVRPDEATGLFDPPLARATLPLLLLRVFQALALAISAVALVQFLLEIVRLTRTTSDMVMVWSALILQLNTIATAAFEVPLPRYMTPLWPLSVAIVVLAGWMAMPLARAALRRSGSEAARSGLTLQPR